MIELRRGSAADVGSVTAVMADAFDPRFGEAWTANQCLGVLAMPGVWLDLAVLDHAIAGFALTRGIAGEAELLLLATRVAYRRRGVGGALLRGVIAGCRERAMGAIHLEVRACNDAVALYRGARFRKVGERPRYYKGASGQLFDAHSYRLDIA